MRRRAWRWLAAALAGVATAFGAASQCAAEHATMTDDGATITDHGRPIAP